jgi:hypothetical protein
MKILSFFVTLALLSGFVAADPQKKENKQEEIFLAAVNERDPEIKMKKLEEYYNLYGAKENQLSRLMYIDLALTANTLKEYDKVVEFGKKALTYENVNTKNQLNLNMDIANALLVTKKEPETAYDCAAKAIAIVDSLTVDKKAKANLLIQAYTIQVLVMQRQPEDIDVQRKAMKAALRLYGLDPAEKYLNTMIIIANRLVKLGAVDEVIGAIEPLFQKNADADMAKWLGVWYDRKGDRAKAVELLKTSFESKQNAKVAYDLGILLQSTDLDAAIDYLAESYLLADPVYSAQAEALLKHLYFNVKAKDMKAEEQELEYNSILDNARMRLQLSGGKK